MIKQTMDYDQFKICDWNRAISKNNLKKIDQSVQKNGWLIHPITVNENMEVVDGQHRLLYAREHNLPVYYTVVENLGIKDCIVMNNSRSAWSISDYINFYANEGNKDFQALKSLASEYTFIPITTLVATIENGFGSGGGSASKRIREGLFHMTDEMYEEAIERLEFLKKCSASILGTQGRATALFSAIAFAYGCPGVDRDRLLKRVQNDINIIVPPANLEMALREIETLYNYRNNKKSYVYIYTEYKKATTKKSLYGEENA